MRRFARWWACVAILPCVACTQTPPLSHATNNLPFGKDISVDDVVQRVKCELADAFDRKVDERNLRWLATWTAKVDLTLQANESGSITPSVSLVEPLHNAYFLGGGPSSVSYPGGVPGNTVGATPQNFNLGISGGYTGQTYRTETVSFSLSLKELRAWREHGLGKNLPCGPVGSSDLQGDLDLKSWVDAALIPVNSGDLGLGIHPAPGSKPSSNGGAGPKATLREEAPTLDTAKADYYKAVTKNAKDTAVKAAQQANATRREAAASRILSGQTKARIAELAAGASQAAIYATLADDFAQRNPDNLSELAVLADKNAEAATQNAAAAKLLANPDPPIDSISHSLNFIVTLGAGVSPNWVLLHWKGPANIGNLASYAGVRTHTLSIALGSPATSTNTEAARVLNNAAFRQAIQSP